MMTSHDMGKSKVIVIKKKFKLINPITLKLKRYNLKLNKKILKNIIKKYDYIVDGSDNFKTKFLLNEYS